MKKILFSLILIFIPSPVFAEDSVVETPVVNESSVEAYVPPSEAYSGLGGWAVVDPNTNVVHGVIVCDVQNCGPEGTFKGTLPGEYLGCTNCNLRFQTKATSDGNVYGYSGHSYEINNDGSVKVNNDNSVKWNNNDKSFEISSSSKNTNNETTIVKKKLIPSKTTSDGKNVEIGIENIETKFESNKVNDLSVKIDIMQDRFNSPSSITVEYPAWSTFKYESVESLKNNIDLDINAKLNSIDTSDQFIETIRILTNKVKVFFGTVFESIV